MFQQGGMASWSEERGRGKASTPEDDDTDIFKRHSTSHKEVCMPDLHCDKWNASRLVFSR